MIRRCRKRIQRNKEIFDINKETDLSVTDYEDDGPAIVKRGASEQHELEEN